MSASQRVVAILVAVLVLAAVTVLVLPLGAPPAANAPSQAGDMSQSPAPTVEGSEGPAALPPPSAAASIDSAEDLLAEIRDVEEQVAAIRGLEPADIGPPELITRAELADELERIFDEEYPPEDRERDNVTLRALGLLDADQDVAELQLQLLGDQVLGFYDDVDKRMVVVTDAGFDAAAKLTYAHEYVHALQDAAFGLDSLETDAVGEDDRGLARTTLLEGDATVTMLAWAFEHMSQEELLQVGAGTPMPDTSGIPGWMIDQLAFPYTTGQIWVTALAGGNPVSPDFTAVDAAYSEPPESTEQIIDLEAWQGRDAPADVASPDLGAALGGEWDEIEETTVGQATIDIMLEHFGVTDAEAADGWGGDRLTVATGPDGDFALAWRLAWDTPRDAQEFLAAYRAVVAELPFAAVVQSIGRSEVLVVHAATEDLLDEVVAAAD